MTTNKWGPVTWTFLHTFVAQIKDELFTEAFPQIFILIRNICLHLPCPECAQHAKEFFGKVNPGNIKTRHDIIDLLFTMHNMVNKRLHKPQFNRQNMKYYRSLGVIITYNNFAKNYNTQGNLTLMTDEFHRQKVLKMVHQWLKTHIHYFNPPMNGDKITVELDEKKS